MKTIFFTFILSAAAITNLCAQAHVNDKLWYNNGAEVYIGTSALLTVQGDVTNNQAAVTGITHFTNNGFVWVQGNMYGDQTFKQSGSGTVRLQNKTSLYTAPYAAENYQVIEGGYRVNGGQAKIATADDGSFYNLELDNQNGLVFIKTNTDVRNSVDFAPASLSVDGNTLAPNGTVNRILTYDPGTGVLPAVAPANGTAYTAVFGMMNAAPGLTGFNNLSTNLTTNSTTTDNAYIQGKLRRAIHAAGGDFGFPLGLEPSTSNTAARGIQYAKLDFTANSYDVVTGYFQQGSNNTDTTPATVCNIRGGFIYFGASNHGEWIFTPEVAAGNAYDLTIYPQDYGTISSQNYFITKDNDVPSPGTQSCGTSPDGLSVSGMTGFSEFGFAGSSVVVPIKLKSFSYTINGCNALLNWVTLAEENVSHFEIEQSINGAEWTTSSVVATTGNSDLEKKYSLPVLLQRGLTFFFRLKTVDIDGSTSYSHIIRANCDSKSGITIYPNPVENTLTLHGLPDGMKYITIYDAAGREINKQVTANNYAMLSFGSLPKAVYVLKVLTAEGRVLLTEKIIK